MLRNVNLKEQLQRERALREQPGALQFVYDMFDVLNEEVYQEHIIQQSIQAPNSDDLDRYPQGVNAQEIFRAEDIRRLCIKYRLRFLDTAQFTAPMPYEAIRKIKQLQKQTGQTLNSFSIVAPAEAFHLPDCKEDPLLFANLGNDRYLLIHQWGNDLNRFRAWRNFPKRNRRTMALTVVLIALSLTALVPAGLAETHAGNEAAFARAAFLGWAFVGIATLVALALVKRMKGYSADVWQRRFS